MTGGGSPCPLCSYILEFAKQLRKSTENLSHGSWLVLDTIYVNLVTLTGLLSISPPRLPVGDFRCLPIYQNKGFSTPSSLK
jgi:hypothetical protein